jgi:hypothetical protein
MNTRTLLNLMLAGVAIVLGLVIFYKPGLEPAAVPESITQLTADSITRIRVTRKERMPLNFVKTGSGWQLENHRELPASEFQLHALLGILSARPARSYPDSALNLAEAGLDPPQATLLLNDTLVYIGGTTPLDRQRYVRYGNTVYLLNDTYQHLVNADWTNFVDRRLVPADAVLTGLQLPDFTLTRDDEQHWRISPAGTEAATASLDNLVKNWQAADATYIRRHDGATDGTPIVLTLADNRPAVKLYLTTREPELILTRPAWGIQYYFPGNMSITLLDLPAHATTEEPPAQP